MLIWHDLKQALLSAKERKVGYYLLSKEVEMLVAKINKLENDLHVATFREDMGK